MSRAKASKERDEIRDKLRALSVSDTAPGKDQAAKALTVEKEEAVAVVPKGPSQRDGKPKPSAKKRSVTLKPVEKIGVSLYPEDYARIEKVENALRKAGLIKRRAATSFLLRVAVATFDENTENLAGIVEELQSQDGRKSRKS